jgi:dipeptidase
MCDTFVALYGATRDGSVIFGKNSDREPNEAQCVVTVPAMEHPAGSRLKCTYIDIPQTAHTNAVLLSKPFWMWGAEMGSNEFGLTIGNEAVFTRVPFDKKGGLTGMDLLRLALERAATAEEGLRTITSLLETHGQGGNCGFAHPFYYHNSFLIADRKEAWILETVGKQWAAVRVHETGAISNHLTIGEEWDLRSDGLIDDALERGFYKRGKNFNFRRVYTDPIITKFSGAAGRNRCTLDYLKTHKKEIDPASAMALLRNHQGENPDWSPDKKIAGSDVCMHAGFGPIRIDQTTGSLVTHLTADSQTHWITGTAAPCISTFKPVWIDAGAPEALQTDSGTYNENSLWWRHEILHRLALKNYPENRTLINAQRDERETQYFQDVIDLEKKSRKARREFSEACARQDFEDIRDRIELVKEMGAGNRTAFYYRMTWAKFNKEAVMSGLL